MVHKQVMLFLLKYYLENSYCIESLVLKGTRKTRTWTKLPLWATET